MDINLDQSDSQRTRYRRHADAFKLELVQRSLRPGASVSRLAREYDVNANQIFAWRKAWREGRLGSMSFLPVNIVKEDGGCTIEADEAQARQPVGRIVLERGEVRMLVEGAPDPQVLRQIVQAVFR